MAKLSKEDFVKALKEMTLLEVKELVDGLKEEFGIDPSAVSAAPAAAAESGDDKEVKVVIKGDGGNKIAVIKIVREINALGLMDAKKAVESLPYVVKEGITPKEAEELVEKIKPSGADVVVE